MSDFCPAAASCSVLCRSSYWEPPPTTPTPATSWWTRCAALHTGSRFRERHGIHLTTLWPSLGVFYDVSKYISKLNSVGLSFFPKARFRRIKQAQEQAQRMETFPMSCGCACFTNFTVLTGCLRLHWRLLYTCEPGLTLFPWYPQLCENLRLVCSQLEEQGRAALQSLLKTQRAVLTVMTGLVATYEQVRTHALQTEALTNPAGAHWLELCYLTDDWQ